MQYSGDNQDFDILQYHNALAAMPVDYVYIKTARGENTAVTTFVFYAVSKTTLRLAMASAPTSLQVIRRELLAIKLQVPGWTTNRKEVRMLRLIELKADSEMRSRFTILHATDMSESTGWYSHFIIEAVHPWICIDLLIREFRQNMNLYDEFTLHVFLELTTALRFLHEKVRIFHGAFHKTNVLINLNKRCRNGLPRPVIIGFGYGRFVHKKRIRHRGDISGMCLTVCDMIAMNKDEEISFGEKQGQNQEPWLEFYNVMLSTSRDGEEITLQELMQRFEEFAITHTTGLPEDEVEHLNFELLSKAEEMHCSITDDDLDNAWEKLSPSERQSPKDSCITDSTLTG